MVGAVAVLGVGAVGGVCAARLCERRSHVVLCTRRPFEELVVEAPDRTLRLRPRVVGSPAEVVPVGWLLLATKAHQVDGAATWLEALTGPDTRIAVLQNGVEHAQRVVRWADPARVVPVVVDCPCTAIQPGHIVQRRPARLVVPDGPDGRVFAELFAGTDVDVRPTDDFTSAAWRKLCWNVASGAIAALAGRPLPEIADEQVGALARALIAEAVAVGRAEGATLEGSLADDIARALCEKGSRGRPSTLTDRLARRPLEVDARNGAVARLGAHHGIPIPVNAKAAELMATCHEDPGDDRLDALRAAL